MDRLWSSRRCTQPVPQGRLGARRDGPGGPGSGGGHGRMAHGVAGTTPGPAYGGRNSAHWSPHVGRSMTQRSTPRLPRRCAQRDPGLRSGGQVSHHTSVPPDSTGRAPAYVRFHRGDVDHRARNRRSPTTVCLTPLRRFGATACAGRHGTRTRRNVTAPTRRARSAHPHQRPVGVRTSRQSARCPADAVQAMFARPAVRSAAAATF